MCGLARGCCMRRPRPVDHPCRKPIRDSGAEVRNGTCVTSDRLTDSLERQWVPGPVLGRGTWGRSRVIAAVGQSREAILKEPLTEADFPADAPLPEDLIAACRACARQQADLLQES